MSDLAINMDAIRDAIAGSVHAARGTAGIILRPGTVSTVSIDQTIAEVQMDDDPNTGEGGGDDVADTGVIGAQILFSSVRESDRVMIMFFPPHGAYVVGRLGGDYEEWTYVGTDGAPAFTSAWGNFSGTGNPGTDTPALVSFVRVGRRVDLRGQAARTTDAAGPDTIFTLPDQYKPLNRVFFPTVNGPLGAVNSLVFIATDGSVVALKFAGSIGGAGGFIGLDNISFLAAIDEETT